MPVGPRLAGMTLDTTTPFTRRAALGAGIGDRQLQGPRFRRVFHGVYLRADINLTLRHQARAALLIAPAGSYVSHHSAVRLWGGWAPLSAETHISSPGDIARTQRRGIRAHRADPVVTPQKRSGIPVSPPIRSFLELASLGITLVDLVAVGDSLVKAGRATPQELFDAAATWGGAGCRRARRAAGFVRTGVDSVMETRLRMLMVLARLPEPQVNKILRAADGSWVFRIDLCYSALLLAIEYEGRQHAENSTQWNSDIRRRTRLEAQGWRLILVTAEGIFEHPEQTVRDIKDALRDRGVSVTKRAPSVEWNREFVNARKAA